MSADTYLKITTPLITFCVVLFTFLPNLPEDLRLYIVLAMASWGLLGCIFAWIEERKREKNKRRDK